jgi:alpha-tubulin suppressor-like RCC1 family protein
VAFALVLSVTLGCVKNRTEIVLGMATDLTATTPLSSVRLQIYSLPEDVLIADQALPISGTVNELYELPGTYAVYSAGGSADRFRALLTATDNNGKTLVVRSAVLSLVPGKTLFARLGMVSACEGMTDCGTGQTCVEGHCASEDIDSSRLPAYTPGMENEVDCTSATTFVDTSTKQPLKVTGTSCGTGTCLEGVCLAPPPTDGGRDVHSTTDGASDRHSTIDGSNTIVPAPSGLLSSSYFTSCMLTGSTTRCWGDNFDGQVGNGSTANAPSPVTIPVAAKFIATGSNHTCAIQVAGTVACWGNNLRGQLGTGTTTASSIPVAVAGLTGTPVSLAAGNGHTCAVMSTGTVMCWGDNQHGEVGVPATATPVTVPTAVSGLSGAVAVSAGHNFTCALLSSGEINCWGFNNSGQLGNGTTAAGLPPGPVAGISGAVAISASTDHACALLSDGAVWCWGNNSLGGIGNGTTSTTPVSTPVAVAGISDAISVAAGGAHTCALLANGTVRCWGGGSAGQLGNGAVGNSPTPVIVAGLSGAREIAAGIYHTCAALGAGGAVACWGDNADGQLGNGTTIASSTPVVAATGESPGPDAGIGSTTGGTVPIRTCPGVVLSSATITASTFTSGTSILYGAAPNQWGTYTVDATGQPTPTLTPSASALSIAASLAPSIGDANWVVVGLYYSSSSCADVSAYNGVKFTLSGDLGACSLIFDVNFADDLSVSDDAARGLCTIAEPFCYGPSANVSATSGMVTVPFSQLSQGSPIASISERNFQAVGWEVIAPAAGCTANFTVSNVTFY